MPSESAQTRHRPGTDWAQTEHRPGTDGIQTRHRPGTDLPSESAQAEGVVVGGERLGKLAPQQCCHPIAGQHQHSVLPYHTADQSHECLPHHPAGGGAPQQCCHTGIGIRMPRGFPVWQISDAAVHAPQSALLSCKTVAVTQTVCRSVTLPCTHCNQHADIASIGDAAIHALQSVSLSRKRYNQQCCHGRWVTRKADIHTAP